MRAFIQHSNDGQCVNHNSFCAFEGFTHLGFEIIPYVNILDVLERTKSDVVHGNINQVLIGLSNVGVKYPEMLDFPEELTSFLGREYTRGTLADARKESNWPLFTKPIKRHKLFTGQVISEFKHLIPTAHLEGDTEVYLFEPVDFVSEYRVFVHRKEIVGCKHYHGDWKTFIDPKPVELALSAFKAAPVAYSLDFGVLTDGRTVLVEVNDFYSLGCYSLNPILYAQAIADRWKEIVDNGTL